MEKHGANRDRQPKFTNDELAIILGEVARHKDVMLSRSLDQETSKFKRQFWQDVAAKLNAINGHALRTASEMHFKWRDWKSRTMRKVAQYQREIGNGKTADEKSNMSDIEQRLVLLLAGSEEEDDSENGNSDADGCKLAGRDGEPDEPADDAEAEQEASSSAVLSRSFAHTVVSSAFESFRSCASLPTQVNMRMSKARAITDNDDDREGSSPSPSPSPLSPAAKRLRPEFASSCNGDKLACVNGNAAAVANDDAENPLRHTGTDSVLLFTLLSTQLKQIQDLAEGQREQLKLFQDFARRREKLVNEPVNGNAPTSALCTKCVRWTDAHCPGATTRPTAERPRLLLGHVAPELSGLAVINDAVQPFQLSTDMRASSALVLFYPHDFTTESRQFLLSFNSRVQQFQAAGCQMVACSTDSQHAHLAWVRMRKEQGGLGHTDLALLADSTGENALRYNVYNYHDGSSHFAVIIIDEKSIVRHIMLTQTSNVDVDALFKLVKSLQ